MSGRRAYGKRRRHEDRFTGKRILPLNVLIERRNPPLLRNPLPYSKFVKTHRNTTGRTLPKRQPFVTTNGSSEVRNGPVVTTNATLVITNTRFVITNARLKPDVHRSKSRIAHSKFRFMQAWPRMQDSWLRMLHSKSRSTRSCSRIGHSERHCPIRGVAFAALARCYRALISISPFRCGRAESNAVQHHH
jgi:hypothetical protein